MIIHPIIDKGIGSLGSQIVDLDSKFLDIVVLVLVCFLGQKLGNEIQEFFLPSIFHAPFFLKGSLQGGPNNDRYKWGCNGAPYRWLKINWWLGLWLTPISGGVITLLPTCFWAHLVLKKAEVASILVDFAPFFWLQILHKQVSCFFLFQSNSRKQQESLKRFKVGAWSLLVVTVFPCATRDTKETHADRAKPKGSWVCW